MRCGGIKVRDRPYAVEIAQTGVRDPVHVRGHVLGGRHLELLRINDLVNRGGMDTISCGAVCAFAVECFENGLLSQQDTDGLELRWGDGEALLRLVEKVIYRKGIGDVLADGVKRAAERIGKGSEKYAVHGGGVEAPTHDPKFDPGLVSLMRGAHTREAYHFIVVPGRI